MSSSSSEISWVRTRDEWIANIEGERYRIQKTGMTYILQLWTAAGWTEVTSHRYANGYSEYFPLTPRAWGGALSDAEEDQILKHLENYAKQMAKIKN